MVAIARDGKLIHYKAYGQLDPTRGRSMRLDAILALASMTRPMIAVAGLILMEQGRLPLPGQAYRLLPRIRKYEGGSATA
ncbi:serine hydrolase [Bradyrhizobium sacchari]|uniref:serine hydrolase n=1 Tax=Bradyrhizobium sacchari TaxID=1399419 RepID=UPI003D318DD4